MVGAFHLLGTHQLWSTVSRSGRRGAGCCAAGFILLLWLCYYRTAIRIANPSILDAHVHFSSTTVEFAGSPDYVQSLDRGLAVIRAFDADHAAMTLSEVAARAALSRAVARRLLLTLAHLGYVRHQGRQFSLTPRVLELGFSFLSSLTVAMLAQPVMEQVAHSIDESCSLAVLDAYDIVYVQRVAVRKVMAITLGIGARLPAFCTSMGRMLLAGLAEDALERWLRGVRPVAWTRFTLIDRTPLRAAVERARAQGYAYVEQELQEGLCSVAVPVRDGRG